MSAPAVQPPGTVEVLADTADYTQTRTWSAAGYNEALIWKAGSAGANADTLNANVRSALVRLRQIQTQANTFAAQAPYGAATLANLNDLLSKAQLIAAAVGDIATDLIALARITSGQYDGTT